MLFRPVYGPELESIYKYLAQSSSPIKRAEIHRAFLPTSQSSLSTQSIDDALSFLASAYLIYEVDGCFVNSAEESRFPFCLLALQRLRQLTNGKLTPRNSIDPLFLKILDILFIRSNCLFVVDIHTEANRIRDVTDLGGISKEKVQAWKRVMASLGIGYRVEKGFQCVYTPALLRQILVHWEAQSGTIQSFLEEHLGNFLPYQTNAGDLPDAIAQPLLYLAYQGEITLSPLQDSPYKSYFGDKRFRHISREQVLQ